MADCLLWKDTITEIRIDPFNATDSEGYIKYIRLIPSGKKPDEVVSFSGLTADAENGECPFYSDNAEVSIVPDPTDAANSLITNAMISIGKAKTTTPIKANTTSINRLKKCLYIFIETNFQTKNHIICII